MKTAVTALFGLALLVAAPAHAQTPEESPAIQVMLVQNADEMSFEGDTLTLKGIGKSTMFFAERPERVVGHMSNDDYVKAWDEGRDSFLKDPPNAALSVGTDDGGATVVVELTDPKLSGDSMSYKVKVLEGAMPATGGPVALFIDPWVWRPRWAPPPYYYPAPYCHYSWYLGHRVCRW